MHGYMKRILIKCIYFLSILSFQKSPGADELNTTSLFSYTGYVTTPSAYVKDSRLGLSYSYLPKNVSILHRVSSDNQIFSASLGFFPFIECYFSVFVAPSVKEVGNYGAVKTRSPGFKIKILGEKNKIPAIAIGIFDPNFKKANLEFSTMNVSSTFLVVTKKLPLNKGSISVGYGFDTFSGRLARLEGMFGGLNINIYKNILLLVDYDTKYWSIGITAKLYCFDVIIALVDDEFPAYRIGYNYNLNLRH